MQIRVICERTKCRRCGDMFSMMALEPPPPFPELCPLCAMVLAESFGPAIIPETTIAWTAS